MALMSTLSTTSSADSGQMNFLDLPYELRLQIYHLVHLSSPAHRPKLAPWSVIPQTRVHIVEAVITEEPGSPSGDGDNNDDTEPRLVSRRLSGQHNGCVRLLSAHRPLCHIPSSLLQTCRQVYAEARTIPFRENEFMFLDWFASGLDSAMACASVLWPWQREALRYLRLEVGVGGREQLDATGDSAGWVRLCESLEGLEGLRLTVKIRNVVVNLDSYTKVLGFDAHNLVAVGTGPRWIAEGVRKLEKLRQLEVELDIKNWTDREKVGWCAKLQEMLVAFHQAAGVRVVCVRKTSGPGQ